MPRTRRHSSSFYQSDLEEEMGRRSIYRILIEVIINEESKIAGEPRTDEVPELERDAFMHKYYIKPDEMFESDPNYKPLPSRFSAHQILDHYAPEERFPRMVTGSIIKAVIAPGDTHYIYKQELLDAKDRILQLHEAQRLRIIRLRAASL